MDYSMRHWRREDDGGPSQAMADTDHLEGAESHTDKPMDTRGWKIQDNKMLRKRASKSQ